MQIQPETIIWNQPSVASKPVRQHEVFRLTASSDDRINGSVPVWGQPQTPEEEITASIAAAKSSAPTQELGLSAETAPKEDDSFGFLDIVDMVNPLQHIPIVSTIYRSLTGDTIKPAARVVGGAAFGGPLGAASGLVNALVQMGTGKDVADNMVASIEKDFGSSPSSNDTTLAVANLRTPRQPTYNS